MLAFCYDTETAVKRASKLEKRSFLASDGDEYVKLLQNSKVRMVNLKQELNFIDYLGPLATFVAFFIIIFIISVTCILGF